MTKQKTSLIFTVEPAKFFANPLTMDNFFQLRDESASAETLDNISKNAINEHRGLRKKLAGAGVASLALKGPEGHPDAVFPNNSFSFHEKDGKILAILYPMSPGRQHELPEDFIGFLKDMTDGNLHDLRHFESKKKYLEGTGVLNFSVEEDFVYMGRSERADEDVLDVAANILGIPQENRFVFDMKDAQGRTIYHTNVISWIGKDIFAICWDSLPVGTEKEALKDHVYKTYSTVLDLSFDEINAYSGNALEVVSETGVRYLTISQSGYEGLSEANKTRIDRHYPGRVIAIDAETIQQCGGGSVRCMEAQGSLPTEAIRRISEDFSKKFSALPL